MIFEGEHCIVLSATLRVLPDDVECAWAERHLRTDHDIGWILGNFVEANRANDNGHIFPLDHLKDSYATVLYKPLNLLHQGRYIVGSYVGAELIEPPEDAAEEDKYPIVEALAGFWRSQFPEEYELIKRAHSEGAAFYSMECVPEEIGCTAEGCGQIAKYVGRHSDTYCQHMSAAGGQKRLLKPHFSAGALIIPPARPGWKQADIRSLARKDERELFESVYAKVEEETPHLGPKEWSFFMEQIVLEGRDFSTDQRNKMAKSGEAMSHGGFPIKNAQDLKNAIQAIGRAKNPAAAKAHIKKRAAALGLTKLLPEGW